MGRTLLSHVEEYAAFNGVYFLFLGQMSKRRAWPRRSHADRQQQRDADEGDGAGGSGGSERSANKSASKYAGIAAKRLEERAQAETDLHHAKSAAASLTPPQRVMLEARNAGIGRGGFVLGGTQPNEQHCPSVTVGRGSRMLGEALLPGHSPSTFATAGSTEPWSPEPQAAVYAGCDSDFRWCPTSSSFLF